MRRSHETSPPPGSGGHLPAWVPCACCEEYVCTIHGGHAAECPCPPVEEWDTDPYSAPPDTEAP